MAVDSQYSDSASADNTQDSYNWRSIGELARKQAEKSGGGK